MMTGRSSAQEAAKSAFRRSFQGTARVRRQTEPLRVDAQMNHQCRRHNKGWQEARREQRGNRGVGDASVDDHRQARWHQNAHSRRGGHDGTGMTGAVALALHRGDHDRSDGRGIRIGRAGYAREENHRDHDHVAEAAAYMSD